MLLSGRSWLCIGDDMMDEALAVTAATATAACAGAADAADAASDGS